MKKYIFLITLFFSFTLIYSQKKTSEKINNVNQQANETTDALEEVSNTADRVLNFGKKIFSKKTENKNSDELDIENSSAYTIFINGVEYENHSFKQIFEKIKKTKNVKEAKKTLKGKNAEINFNFNDNISELWDSIDDDLKKDFKVKKITENTLYIVFKN